MYANIDILIMILFISINLIRFLYLILFSKINGQK